MDLWRSAGRSLHLLDRRGQRLLALATVAQAATALLDLAGVLLLGVVAAIGVAQISGGPLPQTLSTALDSIGVSEEEFSNFLPVVAGVGALLLIAKSLISLYLTRRVLRFLSRRQAEVSGRLVGRVLAWPILDVQRWTSQELAYALTGGVQLAVVAVLGQGVIAISEAVLLVVLAAGLFFVSPWVTLFTILYFAAIAGVLNWTLSGWASRMGRVSADLEVESRVAIQEGLRAYREISVTDRRHLYALKIERLRWSAADAMSNSQFIGALPKYVLEIALVIGAVVLAATQLATRNPPAAIATISVFLVAGTRIVPSILRLQTSALIAKQSAAGASLTYGLAEAAAGAASEARSGSQWDLSDRAPSRGSYEGFVPRIELAGVSLTYPGENLPAVDEASFMVESGQSAALVGSTGAGKSTLADLVLGVLEPHSGTVRISGASPLEVVRRWPGAIGYVPQEVSIVTGTVRDNVALGLPRDAVNDEDVEEALVRAHLDQFLREARMGLDTIVGEYGYRLSGGQRQRLGIARALYTRPKLLVLDEATSALDSETEHLIGETLRALEGTVTTLTIAHRLATIRHCDLILYLEGGVVRARGTFEELRREVPDFERQAQLLGL